MRVRSGIYALEGILVVGAFHPLFAFLGGRDSFAVRPLRVRHLNELGSVPGVRGELVRHDAGERLSSERNGI